MIASDGPDAFYNGGDRARHRRGPEAPVRPAGKPRHDDAGRPARPTPPRCASRSSAPTAATPSRRMNSPSSGGLTVLQMLKMLERFPIGDARAGLRLRQHEHAQRDGRGDAHRIRRPRRVDGRRRLLVCAGQGPARPHATSRCAASRSRRPRVMPSTRWPATRGRTTWPAASRRTRLAHAPSRSAGPGGSTTHFSVADKLGQHGLLHQHHRVVARHRHVRRLLPRRLRRDHVLQELRLPAQQRADRLQLHAVDQPVHRRSRHQRRGARQAPAQQHGADDDLRPARPAARGLRFAGRLDDHQLGVQRDAEPARSPHDDPGGDRRAAAVGHRGGRHRSRSTTAIRSRPRRSRPRRSTRCVRSATR